MANDIPPVEGEENNTNVVQLDERRKEDAHRVEMESLAETLVHKTQVACVKKDSTFFVGEYLINGFIELQRFSKAAKSGIISERLKQIKVLITKHNDQNVRAVFEGALNTANLAFIAEEQRRMAKLREERENLTFDQYPLDRYAAYDQKSGLPIADLYNAQLALKHIGVEGKFNTYREEQTAIFNNHPADIHVLWNEIYTRTRVQWTMDKLETALDLFCKQKSYHPVKDYFNTISNMPSKGIIENWMTVCLGAEDTPLNREIGKKMLVAMVYRTYEPGTKFDQMVVWEGPQGIGKSSVLEMICGSDNFNSGKILDEDNMKIAEALKGRMIFESAELVGHNRDIDKLKSILSKTSDKGRWVYDRKVKDHPRTAIIVGTTNRPQYLIDETGNRRFWPVLCGVVPTANMINGKPYVDFKWMEANRDQLLSEALHLYRTRYSLVLDESLWPAVAKLQDERMTDVEGSERVGLMLGLSEAEGMSIREDEKSKQIELRIHSLHVIDNVFGTSLRGNRYAGQQIKKAVETYNMLEYGLKWIYCKNCKIGKINNPGYQMEAKGDAYVYLKELIEDYRANRRATGIAATENAM